MEAQFKLFEEKGKKGITGIMLHERPEREWTALEDEYKENLHKCKRISSQDLLPSQLQKTFQAQVLL